MSRTQFDMKMFLLARLHKDHLVGFPTVGELEEALFSLPHGETGLKAAYNSAIARIQSQSRALSAKELQHALGTQIGIKELNRKFLPAIDLVDSLCAGLVVFDQNSRVIRLVHYTTKEFLLENPILHDAEVQISMVSLTYLFFDVFSSGRSTGQQAFIRRLRLYPLHHYAAQNWGAHALSALAVSREIMDSMLEFLENEENVNAAAQVMIACSTLGDEPPSDPPYLSRQRKVMWR
ncbi:hypothetical protein BO71DRAFT_428487 [Aspergillus ellipticus CBS 707.79]|uniref:GPI inositol-deacylase winged helix domain-containing protein n=1 Tax=Aspergillus ellipticus CBS 707.79 TaxID=1448320 RepID=A0A319DF02_9EURO|nr:hypothetical protein BO71DRAFT_428487 [Aspergillus ellipticus CBS 707.79]